jgi:hypothetical protein
LKKKYINKNDIKNITKDINKEIKISFDYAKKSNFPNISSWQDLNISSSTPTADKLLKDYEEKDFDTNQKIIVEKGF